MDVMKLGVGLMVLAAFVAEASRADSMPSDSFSPRATHSSSTTCSRIDFSAVQELLDSAVQEDRTRAGIAMVSLPECPYWIATAGEMTRGVPMRDDAILPLASVGKMFTATAAMILLERGAIALEDPVSQYIPEFSNARIAVPSEAAETVLVAPDRPITLMHLLTHTSGLTVTGEEFWAVWDANVAKTTTTHFARDLVSMPLEAQPGTLFNYGQTGAAYEVLGAVIEIASGQTLEAFMASNIFQPLGLDDTYFYLPEAKAERLPEVYRNVDGSLVLDRPLGEDFSRSTFFHGGGGVRSAPADILRFARVFLDHGSVDGVQILKPETVALMMSDQLGELAPERWKLNGRSWGFGAAVEYGVDAEETEVPDQYGWVGGGFAKLWVDPKRRLIAYINFPLTPPGENELLKTFEDRVYMSLELSDPTAATRSGTD